MPGKAGTGTQVQLRVVFDHFPKIIAGLESKAAAFVAKAALDIQGNAQAAAPVDTGFLKNSIQAQQVGPTRWRVTVGADYGVYVEYGTVRTSARPYFHPAIDRVRPAFLAAMKGVAAP